MADLAKLLPDTYGSCAIRPDMVIEACAALVSGMVAGADVVTDGHGVPRKCILALIEVSLRVVEKDVETLFDTAELAEDEIERAAVSE